MEAMADTAAAAHENVSPLPPLRERAAAEVRAWMGRTRMSQRDLAELLGVSQTQVSARMRGQMEFSLTELEMLADAWGIDVLELLRPPAHPIRPPSRELRTRPARARKGGGAESRCTPPWGDSPMPRPGREPWPGARAASGLRRAS